MAARGSNGMKRRLDWFSRVDRKRRRGERKRQGCRSQRWRRKAIPAQLSLADRCICQSVADVSGSFHVVTRHVVIIVHFYLAQSRRVPVTTSIRNAATCCNLHV